MTLGRWRDALDDEEVLAMLQDCNAGRPLL
jgi:hypothetical protein